MHVSCSPSPKVSSTPFRLACVARSLTLLAWSLVHFRWRRKDVRCGRISAPLKKYGELRDVSFSCIYKEGKVVQCHSGCPRCDISIRALLVNGG